MSRIFTFLYAYLTYGNNGLMESIISRFGTDFSPTSIGEFHTKAFRKLENEYATAVDKPRNRNEFQSFFKNMLGSYCEEQDKTRCLFVINKLTDVGLKATKTETIAEIKVPISVTHPILRAAIEKITPTIEQLKDDDLDIVLDALSTITEDIETSFASDDNTSPSLLFQKRMVLSSLEVAKESTKLWFDVFSNPDHPLHPDDKEWRRKLQGLSCGIPLKALAIIPAVLADVAGVLVILTPTVWIQGLLFLVIYNPYLTFVSFAIIPVTFSAGAYGAIYDTPASILDSVFGCVNDDVYTKIGNYT